jgi:hypothetical protein
MGRAGNAAAPRPPHMQTRPGHDQLVGHVSRPRLIRNVMSTSAAIDAGLVQVGLPIASKTHVYPRGGFPAQVHAFPRRASTSSINLRSFLHLHTLLFSSPLL